MIYIYSLFTFLLLLGGCRPATEAPEKVENPQDTLPVKPPPPLMTGAEQLSAYLPLLQGKNIVLTVNHTSLIKGRHLADTLLTAGVNITRIFAPEHGFRGTADAGETVNNGKDTVTGLPVVSLYGKRKKPLLSDLEGIDMVIFDIQDVGARFYTYISTMTYVMEACAEQNIPVLVLDRPNPNGNYIDGPILEKEFSSFVGLHPVPTVHGMTVGEYARMVNGEGWLKNGVQCDLTVIPCRNYNREMYYELPVPPSPNLPNARAVALYPSLCFFEGTTVNAGRGTDKQFQVYGSPFAGAGDYYYTPVSRPGAKYPKHENRECRGYDFTDLPPDKLHQRKRLTIRYLLDFYQNYPDKDNFFLPNNFFDKLAGTDKFRKAIQAGKTEAEIREMWRPGLEDFNVRRAPYLLY